MIIGIVKPDGRNGFKAYLQRRWADLTQTAMPKEGDRVAILTESEARKLNLPFFSDRR